VLKFKRKFWRLKVNRAEVVYSSHLKLPLFQELNAQIIQEHTRHEADLLRNRWFQWRVKRCYFLLYVKR